MVAIKILRTTIEEEENEEMCSARGHQALQIFLPPANITLWFQEYIYSTNISLKPPESRLGKIEYFTLKKGCRLGDHILAWARIAKLHGLLHELSLRREQARLSENGSKCLA